MINLKQDLEARGFLHQFTNEKVFEEFNAGGKNFYFGVDCSADSMTIGNFVALQMAIHFMLRGNKCYLLVGGATSTIGNPGGKDAERPILSEEDLVKNQAGITAQFDILVKNIENITGKKLDYEIVNNYNFFKDMNILDFLKEVGRFMTVNWMINKDIVKKRISDPDKFISYAEFSYMLIMGYDFYYLNKHKGVTLEVGGSDEWDGILSGIELTFKKTGNKVYGVTNKLISDANGKKFGKSEGNAIWLDPNKSSPYALYQYFINTLDDDISKYLKLFSFENIEEIDKLVLEHNKSPEKRKGQKILAKTVVEIIHGTKQSEISEQISELIFGKSNKTDIIKNLDNSDLKIFQKELGGFIANKDSSLFDILVKSGLAKNNSEARQLILSNAISINESKITDIKHNFDQDFLENNALLIQKGKKQFRIILK